MDVLDQYKKAWKNQPDNKRKISRDQIYKMMHKSSSSIVKWIFIIGILEFIFIAVVNTLMRINPEYSKIYSELKTLMLTAEIVSYAILIYFLFKFYKNYKSISVSDNTKTLMSKILKVRKTVRNYIFIVIGTAFLFAIPALIISISKDNLEYSQIKFFLVIVISFIIGFAIIFLIYWLFYQLLYGILLRKLKNNYKELAKLND